MSRLDIEALRGWIGGTEAAGDLVTPRLMCEYAATLGLGAEPAANPRALHWCLAPVAVPAGAIGPDGHPARGGFLPPVPLPRRMWAGSELRLHAQLRVGDVVERRSRIADVTMKEGRTGTLCFVTVEHEITGPRGSVLSERQDIVYRDIALAAETPWREAPVPASARWTKAMTADPVLLFRYSALTFNGHRIHYDRDYARDVEYYPGLVVQGPLQATWLLEFAAEILGRTPKTFTFRSLQPLFDFQKFELAAAESDDGLKLWVLAEGVKTMEALAKPAPNEP